MKKILTMIIFVFICLAANAQDIHGYSNAIANELVSKHDFTITNKDIKKDGRMYEIELETPYADEYLAYIITYIIKQYEDIEVETPWRSNGIYVATAEYRIDDTTLYVIISAGERVIFREWITNNPPASSPKKSIKETVMNTQVSTQH